MISCYLWNSTQGRTDEEWKTQFAWMVGDNQGNWLADLNAWRTARDAGTTLKNFQKTHSGFEPYRGGRHGFTSGPVGDNLQSHHTPMKAVYLTQPDWGLGPAIQMENVDHEDTISYGATATTQYYKDQDKFINIEKKFWEALKMDLADVPLAATKNSRPADTYKYALNEMLDSIYTVKEWRGPLLK